MEPTNMGLCYTCAEWSDLTTVDIAEDGANVSFDAELCRDCYHDRMGEYPNAGDE